MTNWLWRDNTHAEEVLDVIGDAEVIIVNKVVLDKQVLSSAKKLKLICAAAIGVNNIDVPAANRLGITV